MYYEKYGMSAINYNACNKIRIFEYFGKYPRLCVGVLIYSSTLPFVITCMHMPALARKHLKYWKTMPKAIKIGVDIRCFELQIFSQW